MYISIETNDLRPSDAAVLRAIADTLESEGTKVPVTVKDAEPEKATVTPIKKATTRKAAAPEPEDTDEDGSDADASPENDLEAAVARATKLVQAGKTPLVKTALAAVGAKRVSELRDEHVADFLEALDAAE